MGINLAGFRDEGYDEDESEETVQVSEAFCPHCHKALHLILEAADHE